MGPCNGCSGIHDDLDICCICMRYTVKRIAALFIFIFILIFIYFIKRLLVSVNT